MGNIYTYVLYLSEIPMGSGKNNGQGDCYKLLQLDNQNEHTLLF
jgi:hypothetical protein